MTVLVVLAVLFASCSNGMSKDDADGSASAQKVMVSFGVDVAGAVSQKVISGDTNLDGLTYWYKANHNWIQDRPVHGDTGANFIMVPNYTPGDAPESIGYFTAGEWKFWAEVRKGSNVIYSSAVAGTPYTIYTGHASPVITVTPDSTGTGTVSYTVQVPATGGATPEHETLSVLCNGAGGVSVTRTGYANGLATYTGSKSGLTPGAYTLTFRYTDEGNTVTEGAAQAVTVFAGQTSNITGIIDGGKWHPSSITINAPGIDYTSLTPVSGHRTPLDPNPYVITASASSVQGNSLKYQWFLDGVSQGDPAAAATYNFTSNVCGLHDITCAAIDETAKVTASKTIYVQVGYVVTFAAGSHGTVGYGANSSATAVFANGDIVSMSVEPDDGYHVDTLSPAGEYDDASHTATFYMPAADTEFSVTFVADAP